MDNKNVSSFALFGNPVKHSKSPEIYACFAKEMDIVQQYDLRLISQQEDIFECSLCDFFNTGGLGANITTPFKERAVVLCQKLTKRAMITQSINVIKKQNDGSAFLLGDNTDGIGLISDFKRLQWINDDCYVISKKIEKSVTSILLIGSGGAAKGIIPSLLTIPCCHVDVVNRTIERAKQLAQYYYNIGYMNVTWFSLKELSSCNFKKKYDIVINATTSSMHNESLKISPSIIAPYTKCYDLFYQKQDTSFIMWCKRNGSNYCSDGLGMLVYQAAHSFHLWHGFFPTVSPVLFYLRSVI